MIELQGKHNTAKVFTDNIDPKAAAQIVQLLNQDFVRGSRIRIMPDVHAGVGCTVGTTMTIVDAIVPNLVGVDIGCGMETVLLRDEHVELEKLDNAIRKCVPAGFSVRKGAHEYAKELDLAKLRCARHVDLRRAAVSIGTLGGGNHFIELDRDDAGRLYLVVHSGSRKLGNQVAVHYQKAATKDMKMRRNDRSELIAQLKAQELEAEIENELRKHVPEKVDKSLAYVQGQLFDDYMHDMELIQEYAVLNRKAIVDEIVGRMGLWVDDSFTTIHNYIEVDTMILRKGAISAKAGERVLIPINMRDGSLICHGKGNPDWNSSAPHGAGRLMSRTGAKKNITLKQFKASMKGIYSTCVEESTIDESPFAYKPMEEIVSNISDTVDIVATIKPVYNFKAPS